MKCHGICVLVVIVLGVLSIPGFCFGGVSYQETAVPLDSGIQGIVCKPEGDAPIPVVLLLHSFGSHKDEVGNMYQRLTAALGAEGIGSLRIDFRG